VSLHEILDGGEARTNRETPKTLYDCKTGDVVDVAYLGGTVRVIIRDSWLGKRHSLSKAKKREAYEKGPPWVWCREINDVGQEGEPRALDCSMRVVGAVRLV